MSSNLTVREADAAAPSPRTKPPPSAKRISVPFEYAPSDDGTDENLLILLHGLGDTHTPFARLARSLKLPQTATLALRAPDLIPFLYEQAYQWYDSFDALGELLPHPNPTPALALLDTVFAHLTRDCAWPPARVHLFGFAQGGSVAAEFALRWWRAELERTKGAAGGTEDNDAPRPLGSVVTVCGALLSYPTALARPCPTPVLVATRPPPAESALPPAALAAFRKGFGTVVEAQLGPGEGMPRSRQEWEHVMRFWSERLARRQMEGLYEVMSGAAPL